MLIKEFFKSPHVFKIICGKKHILNIETGFAEFFDFSNIIFIKIGEVEFQERALIHFIGLFQICKQPINKTISKNRNPRFGYMEISK